MIGRTRKGAALLSAAAVLAGAVVLSTPASAQNRKKSWEIMIYFGEFGGQKVPTAIQSGVVSTYRLDPSEANLADPNSFIDPSDVTNPRFCTICRNAGETGPGPVYFEPVDPNDPTNLNIVPFFACPPIQVTPSDSRPNPLSYDPTTGFLDECDDDIEAVYRYNAKGIVTNGEVQKSESEFVLGGRLGYNITNHWEIELDLGFTKQRLDMTRNLIPILQEPVSNPADPFFAELASFYQFTWANRDFLDIGYNPIFASGGTVPLRMDGIQEIPNVPQRRFSKNPAADIPALLPTPFLAAETFKDVTQFVNRVFLDPAAIRNRANQINIDVFSAGLSVLYNFNTKPESKVVPYLGAGYGRWMRGFDAPYKGEDSDYINYGGGIRLFVNEIFSFRVDLRGMSFRQDTSTIKGDIPRKDLLDIGARGGCLRDQDPPVQAPPVECSQSFVTAFNANQRLRLPRGTNSGGFAQVEFITETDSFWEARVGFDLVLGGR